MADLSLISPKNNLRSDVKKHAYITQIVSRIAELGLNKGIYKTDNEVLELVCNMLEFLVQKKDKLNKRDLCIEIFATVFGIDEADKVALAKNIEYLWNNGRIKRVSFYKIFRTGVKEWVKKKLL